MLGEPRGLSLHGQKQLSEFGHVLFIPWNSSRKPKVEAFRSLRRGLRAQPAGLAGQDGGWVGQRAKI